MPGLIQQAQSAGAPPAGAMPSPTAAAPAPGGPAASPGAAAPKGTPPNPQNVAVILTAAMKVIHSNGGKGFIGMIKTGGDPATALAHAALIVMSKIYDDSKGRVPPIDLGMAGAQIIKMLAELAQTAGILQATPDMLKQALQALGQLIKQGAQGAQGGGAQPGAAAPAPDAAAGGGMPPAGPADQSQAMA